VTSLSGEKLEPEPAVESGANRRLVLKNTLYLSISQALTVPLSILVNVVVARYLGPDAFGLSYFTFTLCGFGFLIVSWGHDGVLPAVVARDHSQSGLMLGSSLAFRAVLSIPIYLVMAIGCYLFGYDTELQWILALTAIHQLLTVFAAACKDTIRGLERADIPAYTHVGQQLINAAFIIAVVMLGGQLRAAMVAQVAACAIILVVLWVLLRPAGVAQLRASWAATKTLFHGGTPFVVSGLVMSLQPMIDAAFLSKLAPLEVMGWFAVARRLVGVLIFPASALIGALYPTLCRLYVTDRRDFALTASSSLRGVAALVVPVTLGSALYADTAIAIFSKDTFGPAADNLRVLSVFVALVYFSMPLGTCVLAAGKQRAWSFVQSLCLVTSLGLDPFLVPWFQQRWGNGGLGVCLASTLSEVLVVACGVWLTPKGIFDKPFFKSLTLSLVSGAAMALVAYLTSSISPFVSAPLAVLAYGTVMVVTGGIEKEKVDKIRAAVVRRLPGSRA
jgi:O-antigen/teichoic acid export membrane protein